MAATTVAAMPAIVGLQTTLTVDDMNRSNTIYNGLPRINPKMSVNEDHVKNLEAIIAQRNLREKLGIHLLHKHDDLPKGQIKLETKMQTIAGKWGRPASIGSLDLGKIHGVVFKFVPEENILIPYEFAMGPSPVARSNMVESCIKVILGYVAGNDLANVIALELLEPVNDSQPMGPAAEIEVGEHGTIVLPKAMVDAVEFIPTGWPDVTLNYDPDSKSRPQTEWARLRPEDNHKVYTRQVENEKQLLDELALQGILIKD